MHCTYLHYVKSTASFQYGAMCACKPVAFLTGVRRNVLDRSIDNQDICGTKILNVYQRLCLKLLWQSKAQCRQGSQRNGRHGKAFPCNLPGGLWVVSFSLEELLKVFVRKERGRECESDPTSKREIHQDKEP